MHLKKYLPLRVLCLDHEGAHGGSSRSLYALISHISCDDLEIEVWCRRSGHIEDLYREIGVSCRVVPHLPAMTSQPRTFDNFVEYPRFFTNFYKKRSVLGNTASEIEANFDVVHWNHQSFWWLARWMRHRITAGYSMHIRGRLIDTPFARWQERSTLSMMDELIFITDNERSHFEKLAGDAPGSIIFNVPTKRIADVSPHSQVPSDGRLIVASLSNYSWVRGVDRLVDIASVLKSRGRNDILFVVAGNMQLSAQVPGPLASIAARGGSLEEYVSECGLSEYFLFLGHVSEPEKVLASADLLVKLSRENNPWGRDILEALSDGKPVITVGEWSKFVEHGVTGIMLPVFDAELMTDELIELSDNRNRIHALGAAGIMRISELCNGPASAAKLIASWRSARSKRDKKIMT